MMIRITADFSIEAVQVRWQWSSISKVVEEKLSMRILYSVKITFKYKHKIRTFSDIKMLKEFITNRDTLQEMFKEVLQTE